MSVDAPLESPLITAAEAVAAPPADRLVHQMRDVNGVELSLADGSGLARRLPNYGWITLRYKTSAPDRVTGLTPANLKTIVSRVLRANARDAPAARVAEQIEARLREAMAAH